MDINKPMATSSLPRPLKTAARSQIAPFIAMDAGARQRPCCGRSRHHPSGGRRARAAAPARVLDAARRALDAGSVGYTEALGRPALRAAIAQHYRRRYGIAVDPEQVVVTVGRPEPSCSVSGMFDPGDRVIAGAGISCVQEHSAGSRNRVVRIGLGPESHFKPTVAMLEAVPPPIHGLIVASPANPTGTMLDRSELAALATCCRSWSIR